MDVVAEGKGWDEALAHLVRSSDLDSTCMAPRIEALGYLLNMRRYPEADSLGALLDRSRHLMTEGQASLLDWLLLGGYGDCEGALLAARQGAERAPLDFAYNEGLAAAVGWTARRWSCTGWAGMRKPVATLLADYPPFQELLRPID
ncbi:MAG: hypothetical protein P8170_22460 [Gemmatimonadota bacterium]